MPQSETSPTPALPSVRPTKRPLRERIQWALTGLGLALLVLLVLPSAQIRLGASQLHGLIGSYTTNGHTWQVSYSSQGTTTWTARGGSGGSQAWDPAGSGDTLSTSGLDAKCIGTVTGKLKWVPTTGQTSTTDPPPSQVIVTETGAASFNGGGAHSDHGSLLDGWAADTPPDSPNNIYGPHYYYNSGGTHSEVKDGTSGEITIGPFSLNASTPTVTDSNAGNDTIAVAASVTVAQPAPAPTISLPGASTDVDGSKKALTGQGVTAQLNGAPAHVSSYTWSFTGGTPIKNWDPTSTSNDKTIPLAPTDLSATDVTGNGIAVADLNLYYPKAGTITVTCTLNFTSPDGKPGTVAVKSSPIAYLKPTVTWLLTNFNPAFRHPKGFFTDHPNQQYGAEEPWGPVNITVPDPFSGGHGCIAQIATLSRLYTRCNPQPSMPDTSHKRVSVLYNDGTHGAVDTPMGLDISYPYPYGYTKGGTTANPTFTLVRSNYIWEVGSTGYSDDQPFQYFATADVDQGGSLWHDSGTNDSFDTWVMYQPPAAGGGTIYVPLMKLTWRWGGYASRSRTSSGVWSAWTSGEGTPFAEGSPAITDAYPSWPLSIPSGFSVGP